jgi:hypothetical protein
LAQPINSTIPLDSLRILQLQRGLLIYGYYVIMENHCHTVAAGPALMRSISSFKSFIARQIIDRMRDRHSPAHPLLSWSRARHKQHHAYQVWQTGAHPEQINGDAMMAVLRRAQICGARRAG